MGVWAIFALAGGGGHETILRELSLNCGVPHDPGTIIDPFPFHLNR